VKAGWAVEPVVVEVMEQAGVSVEAVVEEDEAKAAGEPVVARVAREEGTAQVVARATRG
jgi:hypothetical protein